MKSIVHGIMLSIDWIIVKINYSSICQGPPGTNSRIQTWFSPGPTLTATDLPTKTDHKLSSGTTTSATQFAVGNPAYSSAEFFFSENIGNELKIMSIHPVHLHSIYIPPQSQSTKWSKSHKHDSTSTICNDECLHASSETHDKLHINNTHTHTHTQTNTCTTDTFLLNLITLRSWRQW